MGDVSYKPLIQDMTWSYSRIRAFTDCPYRWYLKYIRYPKEDRKNMFFSDYGTFVHELIAAFYSGEKTAEQIHTEYLTGFKTHVLGRVPNNKVFINYFVDGSQYLKSIQPSKNEVVAVEQKVETTVGNISFVGYIDRVDRAKDGGLLVIDNKSRTLKPRSHRATPTKADIELDEYLVQLYVYSSFVRDTYGVFPHKLCFNCFRNNLFIEEPFVKQDYNKAIRWVSDMVCQIENEENFRPNMDYFKCRYLCEMNDHCDYYQLSRR